MALVAASEQGTAVLEQALLGLMLGSKQAVWRASEGLSPDDFEDPRHEVIARCIVRLARSPRPSSQMAVLDALEQDGQIEQAGGIEYVMRLDPLAAGDALYFAEQIRARALRRRLRSLGRTVGQLADEPGDPVTLLNQVEKHLRALRQGAERRVAIIRQSLPQSLDSIGENGREGLPTPWPSLNELISGLLPGKLYVIGARPSSGKTMMALNLAAHISKTAPVAFSSIEMSERELQYRLLASEGKVRLAALDDGRLSAEENARLGTARQSILGMRLYVDDRGDVSVPDIELFARSAAREEGDTLGAIVVDYVGLVRPEDARRPRWEQVKQVSRDLKLLAKELDCAVVVCAQLSRESERVLPGKKPRPPQLSDLRESGDLEQDADVVILLQRGEANGYDDSPELGVHVAKNRQGRRGIFQLDFQGWFATLRSRPRTPELPIEDPDDE